QWRREEWRRDRIRSGRPGAARGADEIRASGPGQSADDDRSRRPPALQRGETTRRCIAMSTDYPTTAGLPAQDRTARQPAIEFNDNPLAVMLDKAGRQTPDGANIVGILELALLVLPLSFNGERGLASSWVCANGEPVFVGDEG